MIRALLIVRHYQPRPARRGWYTVTVSTYFYTLTTATNYRSVWNGTPAGPAQPRARLGA